MKRSTILPILVFAQVAVAIFVAIMAILLINSGRNIARQNAAIERFNVNQRALNVLMADTAEYAKRNPAILPILGSMGFNVGTNNAAPPANLPGPVPGGAPRPAVKPAGR